MAKYIVRIECPAYVHYWRTGRPVGGAPTTHRAEATRYDHWTAHKIAEDLCGATGYPVGERITIVRA